MACVLFFVYAVLRLQRSATKVVVSAQTPKTPRGRYVDRAAVEFDASVSHYDELTEQEVSMPHNKRESHLAHN